MMFDAWNNSPWTTRGIIFKNTIEALLIVGGFFLVLGIIGGVQ